MKITAVDSYIGKGIHIIKVHTDAGITGIGECSAMDPELTAQIVSKRFRDVLIGKDPHDVNRLQEDCLVGNRGYKIAGQLMSMAYSGIDIALWDIMGKAAGQPVYNLLGGKYRDKILLYGSSMSRDLSIADEMTKLKGGLDKFGFNAVKIKVGPRMDNHRVIPDLDYDEAKVRATRELIGPKRKLLVDVNSSYTYSQAITFAKRIEKYDIFQYEEPCPFYDLESYKKTAEKINLPINAGEQDWNLHVMLDFIKSGACQIAAADATKSGGITTVRKVAAICDAFGIVYSPHNTSRGIGTATHLQICTAMPACNHYQEYSIEAAGGSSEYLSTRFIPVDGTISAPTTPGIGVELDEEKVATLQKV